MGVLAMVDMGRVGDYWIAGIAFLVVYCVGYPLYIVLQRVTNAERAHRQTITTVYKLPISLRPAEVSYLFSPRIKSRQLKATILDLANRSVLVLRHHEGSVRVSMGPKSDTELKLFEKLLVGQIHRSKNELDVKDVINGNTIFLLTSGEKIDGSKAQVFWWLLRHSMQEERYIEKHNVIAYFRTLMGFLFPKTLILYILSIVIFRFVEMTIEGGLKMSILVEGMLHGVEFWAITFPIIVIVSFVLLRFRGKMLGRDWIFALKLQHYKGQIDAYREFVRLAHRGKLKFMSKEVEKESLASTNPYALALGYVKRL